MAEGVETEEQSRLLRLLGCDEMQGFLFSSGAGGALRVEVLASAPGGHRRIGGSRRASGFDHRLQVMEKLLQLTGEIGRAGVRPRRAPRAAHLLQRESRWGTAPGRSSKPIREQVSSPLEPSSVALVEGSAKLGERCRSLREEEVREHLEEGPIPPTRARITSGSKAPPEVGPGGRAAGRPSRYRSTG